MRLRPALLVIPIALVLAACSGPTEPDRSTPSAAPDSSSAAAADASAPFLTTDCAAMTPPVASNDAPADAQGLDGVFVSLGDQDVPSITISDKAPDATSLQSLDLVTGKGPAVQPGQTLTVNYCGVGLTSRSLFDSSWVRGEPASFALDGLIQGWIDGLPGMTVGSERLLIIPGELAYGPNPPTQAIGPNETLVFVIQLLDAK